MFDRETQLIEEKIHTYCAENEIPLADLKWVPIPFNGEWGTSTSFFQTAANEARSGKKVIVPQRAQELAASVKIALGEPKGISRVEAVKGYLNLYFATDAFAQRVVDSVLGKS